VYDPYVVEIKVFGDTWAAVAGNLSCQGFTGNVATYFGLKVTHDGFFSKPLCSFTNSVACCAPVEIPVTPAAD